MAERDAWLNKLLDVTEAALRRTHAGDPFLHLRLVEIRRQLERRARAGDADSQPPRGYGSDVRTG